MNPIDKFKGWYQDELEKSNHNIPSACCFSTIGLDGYPNSRFVSLKEIVKGEFIIAGPLSARKGLEVNQNSKVSLTFWWTQTEKQIRIQGDARKIADEQANKYFEDRHLDSKIVSIISQQGEALYNEVELEGLFHQKKSELAGSPVARPENWGGLAIQPLRIEFLAFRASRFHHRELFTMHEGNWRSHRLQP